MGRRKKDGQGEDVYRSGRVWSTYLNIYSRSVISLNKIDLFISNLNLCSYLMDFLVDRIYFINTNCWIFEHGWVKLCGEIIFYIAVNERKKIDY